MQVSGHQAWMVEFGMNYPDGASQGLTWSSELGAVVVVDRGASQAPAVFYVSVPASLGTQNVATLPRLAPAELTGRGSASFRDADVAAAAVHLDRVAGRVVGRHRGAVVAAARSGS